MALLDVSDLLADLDLADTLTLIRSVEAVRDDGLAERTETSATISGVVQSGTGDMLRMGADAAQASGAITVYTTAPLRVVTAAGPADVLEWRGRRYTVRQVSDWSNFGAGHYAATCELQALTA